MRFVTAVALAVVMLWVPVDGVAQRNPLTGLSTMGQQVACPQVWNHFYRSWSVFYQDRYKTVSSVDPCGPTDTVHDSSVVPSFRSRSDTAYLSL